MSEESFNSQRDGILLLSSIANILRLKSFNSQRDGILPKRHRHSKQLRIVSIPNGMEFYFESLPFFTLRNRVSIPNGMEFYDTASAAVTFSKEFQFPTGWNSTFPLCSLSQF